MPPSVPPEPTAPPNDQLSPKHPPYKFLVLGGLILLIIVALVWWWLKPSPTKPASAVKATASSSATAKAPGLQLDTSKNYGNKYANGILPVGDQKYTTDTAKAGYIFACAGYANNLNSRQGGAGKRGPWFIGTTQFDVNKKSHVSGSVSWQPSLNIKLENGQRIISTNDLPSHKTGIFPIRPTDPAYMYDRNPNSISAQSLNYTLNAAPTYGSPQCIGGQVGVMLTGVLLFSGFDAEGRDAGAWEVQDGCDGHPERTGEYHYHTLSRCISDVSVGSVIGFALDGFPITGPKISDNNILSSSDLDECHGITSQVTLDNKKVTTYHYVMTEDFPYSVSCYRSQPAAVPAATTPARQP